MSDTYFADKTLVDLQDEKIPTTEVKPTFTKAKKDECLKYVKWQDGCVGQTEGNEEYIGKGDKYICKKVGITQVQLDKFKADMNEAVVALQPKETPIEEITK